MFIIFSNLIWKQLLELSSAHSNPMLHVYVAVEFQMDHIYLSLLFKIFLYKYEYGNLCKRHDYNANSEYVHFQLYIILLFKYFTIHYSIIWLNNIKVDQKIFPFMQTNCGIFSILKENITLKMTPNIVFGNENYMYK